MTTWFLALLSRDILWRRGLRLTRKYRDLVSCSEVMSAVDLGLALAVKKYDHTRGPFVPFAWRIAGRALTRFVRRELAWRARTTALPSEEQVPSIEDTSIGLLRREVHAALGRDFDTFMQHHAWGSSLRELGRREGRSIRSVRDAVSRANRRIFRLYQHPLGDHARTRTSARQSHSRLLRLVSAPEKEHGAQ